ncbi:MAG: peptidylprolyl isomerase [Phycisphaerales bacterium]
MNTTANRRPSLISRLLLGAGSDQTVCALESRQMLSVAVTDDISDIRVDRNQGPSIIALDGRYDDTDISVATFVSTLGEFDVLMYDAQKPITVTNFWRYADADLYDGTIIHRSVPGFIVQGGGYADAGTFLDVPAFPAITNEFSVSTSNIRGTIAMAKLGSNPNSATTEWFFNLANNSANLDNQNGGFTVFGRVLGDGMSVVDSIAAQSRYALEWLEGAFSDIPLRNYTEGTLPSTSNTIGFSEITRGSEFTYSVTVGNQSLVSASVISGYLNLNFGANQTGSTTVTVRATSINNTSLFVEDTFTVTVEDVADTAPSAVLTSIQVAADNTGTFNEALRATFRINNSASVVPTSIGDGDVVLLGAGGFWQGGTLVGLPEQGAHSLTVTYDFPARLGRWDSTDNGTYALRLLAGTVSTVGGGTMAVQNPWSNFLWFDAPTVARVSETVSEASTNFDVVIRYTDAAGASLGISWSSVSDGDVTLEHGTSVIQGSLIARSIPAAGQILATYRFAAPSAGVWDHEETGAWALRMQPSAVFDNSGYLIQPRDLQTYNLYFSTPTAEYVGLQATSGTTTATLTMKYITGPGAFVSWDAIGAGDLEFRGPNNYLSVASLVSKTASRVNGRWEYTVVYSFGAPGGTWNTADNGSYDLLLRASEVYSSAGYAVPTRSVASGNLTF